MMLGLAIFFGLITYWNWTATTQERQADRLEGAMVAYAAGASTRDSIWISCLIPFLSPLLTIIFLIAAIME